MGVLSNGFLGSTPSSIQGINQVTGFCRSTDIASWVNGHRRSPLLYGRTARRPLWARGLLPRYYYLRPLYLFIRDPIPRLVLRRSHRARFG